MRLPQREVCLTLCLAALVVLAGCSFPVGDGDSETPDTPAPSTDPSTTPDSEPVAETPDHDEFSDPDSDVIGWEDGYWYDEPLTISQDDGLTDQELDALVARSMARVEYLRDAEFEDSVDVTVLSRDEYMDDNPYAASESEHNDWNNQVWEALFIVGEHEDIGVEFERVTGASVLGYYSPDTDELVIVSNSKSSPTADPSTLVHELVHALQDQRFDLGREDLQPPTQDAQLAKNGLVEGEAKYIEQQYLERCDTNEWQCVEASMTDGTAPDGNLGIQLLLYQPYSDGPAYIQYLLDTGGWDAVDSAFESPPTQTAQILHPGTDAGHADFAPIPNSRNGWSQFVNVGETGADRVGEASVYMMFWFQSYQYHTNTIPRGSIRSDDPNSQYSYEHSVSHGLVDDRLTPYKNGDERGYIWQLRWTNEAEADEFLRTYERLLQGHGGERVAGSTWVIRTGGFADAYYIEQNGADITIVNAPTREALIELYPPAENDSGTSQYTLLPSADVLLPIGAGVAGLGGLLLLAFKS